MRRNTRVATTVGSLGVLSGLCVLVLWGCTNDQVVESCTINPDLCIEGTFCDRQTQQCLSETLAESERCTAQTSCPDTARPVCVADFCRPCTAAGSPQAADRLCRALSLPGIETCIQKGPRKGQCGECLGSEDCKTADRPVCEEGMCRPCRKHRECVRSGICQDDSGVVQRAGLTKGQCLPEREVIFVDGNRCPVAGATGEKDRPFCDVAAAISATTGEYLLIRPRNSGMYGGVTISQGTRRVLVGAGPKGAPLLSSVTATAAGTEVLLTELVLSSSGTALGCTSGATLRLLRSSVLDSGTAVDAQGCQHLEIAESQILKSRRQAIRIGAGTKTYRVVGSLISDTLATPAVSLTALATGVFAQNTLVNNGTPGLDGGAISCEGPARLADSIIVQNGRSLRVDGMGRPLGSQLVGACKLSRVVTGLDVLSITGAGIFALPDLDTQLRLMDTPNNEACCIDKAALCESKLDFFDNDRPLGSACDLGAHELR